MRRRHRLIIIIIIIRITLVIIIVTMFIITVIIWVIIITIIIMSIIIETTTLIIITSIIIITAKQPDPHHHHHHHHKDCISYNLIVHSNKNISSHRISHNIRLRVVGNLSDPIGLYIIRIKSLISFRYKLRWKMLAFKITYKIIIIIKGVLVKYRRDFQMLW